MTNPARALKRMLSGRPDYSELSLPPRGGQEEPPLETPRARPRVSGRALLLNLPLLLGLLIVIGLFFLTLFGPLLAPENPYLVGTTSLTVVDGQYQSPPFPPSDSQPLGSDQWGRDILSMLLYGARNTLVAAVFITMARVVLGTILGIIAGWNDGKGIDRLIMGAVGVTTALPLLLVGMILIFALDIRKGIAVFLIALCVVGWGEIAQYIRGEFVVLRKRSFIEGARVMGLTGTGIAIRHILPNILPALVVITLLEMGATLMLLGELGFVGVFMGGGTAQESLFEIPATIPDIPEWGAMMADSRVWARGRPWMVLYPALAFFIAVLGFNALGEGLRQLIERSGFNTAVLLSKRMLVVVAVIVGATWWVINNVGPAPSYAKLAANFDGEAAMAHVTTLAGMDRRAGSQGHQDAADYIAARFEEYGLQRAGGGLSYFHRVDTTLVEALRTPQLALLDGDGRPLRQFQHQIDFGFRIEDHGGSGQAQAPITLVTFNPARRTLANPAFAGMDLRGQVALVLGSNAPQGFTTEALIRGAEAVLMVEAGPQAARSHTQFAQAGADYVRRPTLPVLAITPEAAEAILGAGGSSLAGVQADIEALQATGADWEVTGLPVQAQVSVELSEAQEVTLSNVLGYLPGQDVALDRELVIISSHYDSLGREPDGQVRYDGVDDSLTGLAAMLEIARLWHEQGYTPRRTVLFAAFTGSELQTTGAQSYLQSYGGPVGALVPVAGFNATRLGAGGAGLLISDSPQRVSDLLQSSAGSLGVAVERGNPLNHSYQQVLRGELPTVVVERIDSAVDIREDSLERISVQDLQEAGEAINLALIVVSRDASW